MASLAELIRSDPKYKDNYEWFVELAKNFHWIQSKMVESIDKVRSITHGVKLIVPPSNKLIAMQGLRPLEENLISTKLNISHAFYLVRSRVSRRPLVVQHFIQIYRRRSAIS